METSRMKVVNVPVSEIVPYENNPRVNEGSVEQLAKIIEQFGFRNPAVLNKDKVIIEGHTRLLAVKKLGWETMPCIIATDLTPEQEQALRIADNKIAEIAEWDEDKLKVELAALQEAGFDLSLLAFGDDELDDLLGGEAGTHGETEPDAVPETPEVPVSTPGEVYQLGKHLLVCGDSTKPNDVDKVCKADEADLWLTDPPYNVDYHGSDGQSIQNDSMEDTKFREFLRAAFGCAEKRLKPGGSFYIFHADSEGYNFRGACFDVGLRVRQCLIWKKQSLVLGRQDYHWIHEPCQPAGTMVLTVDGPKGIETLTAKDRVISYDKQSGTVKGYRNGGYAIKTASRHYDGKMYSIRVGDSMTRATDNHAFTIRFNPACRKKYCTYLMRRGDWWRIGMTKTYDARQFGVKTRLHQEKGDAAWIIGLYDDKVAAQTAEQLLTVKYGIPYTIWEPERFTSEGRQRTRQQIAEIYAGLDLAKMAENARRLLLDANRSERFPLFTKESSRDKFSRRVTTKVCACNLLPDLMQVPMPLEPSRQKNFEWRSISAVEAEDFSGEVYSLAVEKLGHYIADGIITHNCLYGWKDGEAHNWYADRSQTTVMEYDKPKKNDVHPTMKPVDMLCYLIGNSSKRGDTVLDTFGGSGSTLIACERTGRVCKCVELDPKYCDVIRKRWAEFVHGEGCDWQKLTPKLDGTPSNPDTSSDTSSAPEAGESTHEGA